MKSITRIIDGDQYPERFGLFVFFDIHLGSIATDEKLLLNDIARVENNKDFWVDGGDSLECINRTDKRHKEELVAPWAWGKTDIIQAQIERYKKYFSPISKQCLCKSTGNHEESVLSKYERDVNYELVSWMKNQINDDSIFINGGLRTIINLCFRWEHDSKNKPHQTYNLKIFVGHGYGGGRLEGAPGLRLGRILKEYNVDLAYIGHSHQMGYIHQNQFDTDFRKNKIIERDRYAYHVPSYRKTLQNELATEDKVITDYTDIKLFPPSIAGGVRTIIDFRNKTIIDPMRNF